MIEIFQLKLITTFLCTCLYPIYTHTPEFIDYKHYLNFVHILTKSNTVLTFEYGLKKQKLDLIFLH